MRNIAVTLVGLQLNKCLSP